MADVEVDERDHGHDDEGAGPVFSPYGILATMLALVAVAAVVLVGLIWTTHRAHADELDHRTRVMAAASDWTGVLINMNEDNIEASLQKLHDGTVGELNADFDAAVTPYRDVVRTLQSHSTGQIEAVAYESVHHDLDAVPGSPPPAGSAELDGLSKRTDTVIVIATSVSENAGGTPPRTVRWNLRLGVSDVDGKLLISRLESMR